MILKKPFTIFSNVIVDIFIFNSHTINIINIVIQEPSLKLIGLSPLLLIFASLHNLIYSKTLLNWYTSVNLTITDLKLSRTNRIKLFTVTRLSLNSTFIWLWTSKSLEYSSTHQSFAKHFETFWCFTKFYHKWNGWVIITYKHSILELSHQLL